MADTEPMSDSSQVKIVGAALALVVLALLVFTIGGPGKSNGTRVQGDGFSFEAGDAKPVSDAQVPEVAMAIPVADGLQGARAAKAGSHVILAGTLSPTGVPPGPASNPDVSAQLDRFIQDSAKRAGYPEAYGPTYRKIKGKVALGYQFRPAGTIESKASAYYVVGATNVVYGLYCTDAGDATANTACSHAVDSFDVS